MILLYCLLDICFYNFTIFQTHLFLIPLVEKEHHFLEFLFYGVLLNALLNFSWKFLCLLLLLYLIRTHIKIKMPDFKRVFLCFGLLYLFFFLFSFLLYQKITTNLLGFFMTIFFLFFSYKFTKKA